MNPFSVERRRDFYAKKGYKKKFLSLYNKNLPTIPNVNTNNLWNKLNSSRLSELKKSPIYRDKVLNIKRRVGYGSGKLLDIGFGHGFVEDTLKYSGYALFGIDISNKSVKEIRQRIRGKFEKGDVLKIPHKSNYFDYILCLDVLEHVSPRHTFKALREIKRVGKTNSKLIVSIPLNEGLEKMIKERKYNPNAHVRTYTPEILKTELEISGFKIINETYLSAFNKFYLIKKILNNLLRIREPNLLIFVAQNK